MRKDRWSAAPQSTDREALEHAIGRALTGEGAHVEATKVFEGLDWRTTGIRPQDAPHSIFQLLQHVSFWQEWVVGWLDGKSPPLPSRAAETWSGRVKPSTARQWQRALRRFEAGLEQLRRRSRQQHLCAKRSPKVAAKTRLEMLQTIALHNSYHLGQVVLLRQMLGAWPPPSGGMDW